MTIPKCNQVWQDNGHYLDNATGLYMRKYVLILSCCNTNRDCVTAVFTTKPNGLGVAPPCSNGPPRSGYYVGAPGAELNQPSWIEFSNLQTLDWDDLSKMEKSKRMVPLSVTLQPLVFCGVLRCVSQCEVDDLEIRQHRQIGNTIALLGCP